MDNDLAIEELERRMRPGALSVMGFLGPHESLETVLARDAQTLEALGISYEELASALEKVVASVLAQKDEMDREELKLREVHYPKLHHPQANPHFSLGNLPDLKKGFLVEGELQVFLTVYRGAQKCPWDCKYDPWSNLDFLILNRRTGEFVTGPGMIVHLIREHHFFEGVESPYRVDPERAARVLQLV